MYGCLFVTTTQSSKRGKRGKEEQTRQREKRAQEVSAAPALQLLVIIFSRADAGLLESSECWVTLEHKKEDTHTHNGATTSPEKRDENDVSATCFSPFSKRKRKRFT